MDGGNEQAEEVQMLTPDEAAELLNVSRRQVYRLVQNRVIPHVRLGGCIRFERGVLVQWVKDEMLKGIKADDRSQERPPVGRRLLHHGRTGHPDAIPPVTWTRDHVKATG